MFLERSHHTLPGMLALSVIPLLIFVALTGCRDNPTSPVNELGTEQLRFMGKPDKPGGPTSITPLSVVLTPGLEVADDGAGAYVEKDGEVLARILGNGNFGLDLRGSVKGKGKNSTGIDRRICMTLTERGTGAVLFQECVDAAFVTNRPDAAHPEAFNDLTDPADVMTTAMRFLWGNETDSNVWLNAAGVEVGRDVWLRYGTQCWDDAAVEWPEVPSERAVATVEGNGWKIVADDAYWCGRFPDENHTPVGPDPDGRVSATVEFILERL